ncbi:hypothetical protein MD484_g3094, partial [Candolleomyces efflorescens]
MASKISHTPQPSFSSTADTIVEKQTRLGDGFFDDHSSAKKPSPTLPPVIPPTHQRRTLIVCFDGTGDQFDADNSNVVQFVSLLKKDDRNKQLVYYQILDTMLAGSINAHIMGGYKFLMQNYVPGDQISIFGFSRGAYTARCLVAMLHKVGLLPPSNSEQVPFAYTIYLRTDDFGWEQANEFKRAFSINVDVEFLGVWDTVGSIGFRSEELPFATSTTFVKTYRHAISLDERRAKFQANQWNEPSLADQKRGLPEDETRPRTNIEEVWFAGCHSDVGGGSVRNQTRHSLARIPLRWMVREIFKAQTGILFLTSRLHEIGLDPSTLYPTVLPRPTHLAVQHHHKLRKPSSADLPDRHSISIFKGKFKGRSTIRSEPREPGMLDSEEHEELMDALSPMYDQMELRKWWWILEYTPLPLRRVSNGESKTKIR